MSSRSGSVARTKSAVHKDSSSRSVSRRAGRDSTDTFGIRGAGASWQASFGMALNERDLLFAVRREPVAWRLVFQVAHMAFLHCWNSEVFVAISSLITFVSGIIVGKKASK